MLLHRRDFLGIEFPVNIEMETSNRLNTIHNKTARGDLRLENGGGSALLLSLAKMTPDEPAMIGTCQPLELTGSHLHKRFAAREIFDHKCSFDTPSTDIAHSAFSRNLFIQLPPFDFARGPHPMLAAFPVVQLIMAAWETAHLMHDR